MAVTKATRPTLDDELDESHLQMRHVVVPASSAPPVHTQAACSVFALADQIASGEAGPRQAVPLQAVPAQVSERIVCGLYSSGEISIEARGQKMHLSATQSVELLAWLSKVDQVLRPEASR